MTAVTLDQSQTLTDALWARYRSTGDPDARSQLLDRYLGLVHHVAREIGARTTAVELDDLVSAGTLGLVRALDTFDLSRGLAFSTYAVRRIRGSILDDLRSRDWTPRSVRAKARKLQSAVNALVAQLGRAPEPQEIATALGIELETYFEWKSMIDGGVMVPYDAGTSIGGQEGLSLEETMHDEEAELPGQAIERQEMFQGLRDAIATLPEKERTVLALYYYEELNLRQIAEVLHVTESRISQIRSAALKRLRARMTEPDEDDDA